MTVETIYVAIWIGTFPILAHYTTRRLHRDGATPLFSLTIGTVMAAITSFAWPVTAVCWLVGETSDHDWEHPNTY